MTRQELAELAARRAKVCKLLSRAYAKPADEWLLNWLRPWVNLPGQLSVTSLPTIMKRGLKKLGAWLERAGSPPSAESVRALETEFTWLFRGVSRSYSPPPPYESVYREGVLYGNSTQQVAERYRSFQLKSKDNEPPDHIAVELDFMRFLCEKETQAWQQGEGWGWLEQEAAFMNEHLARWVPTFCENILRWANSDFYSGIADLTQGWLVCDRRVIQGLLRYKGEL